MLKKYPIQILAVLASERGAGVTTTAVHLGAALAEAGRRVLLVDLGDDAAASHTLGVHDGGVSVAAALHGQGRLGPVVTETEVSGLTLARGEDDVAAADARLAELPDRAARLHRMLLPARTEYDVILIDAPPTPSLLAVNVLAAADAFLLPAVPTPAGAEAVQTTEALLRAVWQAAKRTAPILGCLLTRFVPGDAQMTAVAAALRSRYGGKVFEQALYPLAGPQQGLVFGTRAAGTAAYTAAAQELVERLGRYSTYYAPDAHSVTGAAPAVEAAASVFWQRPFPGAEPPPEHAQEPHAAAPDAGAASTLERLAQRPAEPAEALVKKDLGRGDGSLLPISAAPLPPSSRIGSPARLAALARTGLLEVSCEPGLDRITRVAQRLLAVPTTLVSLVDDERQVFVSAQGLDEPWATACATPLSHSFCQYVVAQDAPLIVPDAHAHPFLQKNQAVEELGVVAYLGVPVRDPNGAVLGALCAISPEPRAWSKEDVESLQDLGALVDAEIGRLQNVRRFHTLLDSPRTMVFAEDGTGLGTEVGAGWSAYTGVQAETAGGQGWLDMLHEDDRESVAQMWRSCFESGEPYSNEIRLRGADGIARRFQVEASPALGASGRVLEYVGTYTDIEDTRRKEERLHQQEEQLHQHEALVQALFASSPFMMGLVEVEGDEIVHLHANAATARFHGLTQAEFAGRRALEAGESPEVVARWVEAYREAHASGQPVTFEFEQPLPDGPRTVEAKVSAVGTSAFNRPLFAYVASDVTADRHREAEYRQADERHRLALEAGRLGTWEVDLRTERMTWSPRLHRLHGVEHFDGRLETALSMMHPEDLGSVIQATSDALARARDEHNPRFTVEYRAQHGDGVRWFRTLGRIYTGPDGDAHLASGVTLDITEERERAAAVAALAARTEEAQRAVEAVAELQQSILHNMSHEIRTPLTAVLGCAEVLAMDVEGEQAEMVDAIRNGGKRLMSTLDALLELARMDAGYTPHWQEVDLSALAEEVATERAASFERKSLTLSVRVPAQSALCRTDGGAVRRVLEALLSNAAKFTREGGAEVAVVEREEHVALSVEDTGSGIPAEDRAALFEPFVQASSGLSRSHEGSGLGLALVRSIAKVLGARVEVESEEGTGSTFTLLLPHLPPPEAA